MSTPSGGWPTPQYLYKFQLWTWIRSWMGLWVRDLIMSPKPNINLGIEFLTPHTKFISWPYKFLGQTNNLCEDLFQAMTHRDLVGSKPRITRWHQSRQLQTHPPAKPYHHHLRVSQSHTSPFLPAALMKDGEPISAALGKVRTPVRSLFFTGVSLILLLSMGIRWEITFWDR